MSSLRTLISTIKENWEDFLIWHDTMQYQNSPERQELAVTRIHQLRAFTSGESDFNPYAELYEE
jgi:hypothetical protein